MREIEAQTCKIWHLYPSIQWSFINAPSCLVCLYGPSVTFLCSHSQTHTHTQTQLHAVISLYAAACVCWGLKGVITVFILWPSVWPSQRASFSPATVGHWRAGPSNIWIAWLAASHFYAGAERDTAMENARRQTDNSRSTEAATTGSIQADSFF